MGGERRAVRRAGQPHRRARPGALRRPRAKPDELHRRVSLRVLLAGGGSGGSATPVLAVAQALRRRDVSVEFLYVGTREGPEATLAAAQGIPFAGVESGKVRRYWDPHNLTDPSRVAIGVAQAYRWARRFR